MKKVKVAYVRTQFWFGLDFGGSVSHTSGVLKGFQNNKCNLKILSNELFFGIKEYSYTVIKPLIFNKKSNEIGELLSIKARKNDKTKLVFQNSH